MANWTKDLHELCDKITDEISEANKKLDKNNGIMTAGDLDYIDKLTHTLKSIKTTIAMSEYDDDYSGAGRKRDSMGRYSRDGHMYHDRYGSYDGYGGNRAGMRYSRESAKVEMIDQLRDLERSAGDDETKHMIHEWIKQVERN